MASGTISGAAAAASGAPPPIDASDTRESRSSERVSSEASERRSSVSTMDDATDGRAVASSGSFKLPRLSAAEFRGLGGAGAGVALAAAASVRPSIAWTVLSRPVPRCTSRYASGRSVWLTSQYGAYSVSSRAVP